MVIMGYGSDNSLEIWRLSQGTISLEALPLEISFQNAGAIHMEREGFSMYRDPNSRRRTSAAYHDYENEGLLEQ